MDIILGVIMGNLLLAGLIWVANRMIERHNAKKTAVIVHYDNYSVVI